MKKLLFILSISMLPFSGMAGVLKDSVGVEKKGGKNYIVYKVDAGETLYSISRKYNVSVDEIKASNEGLANGLRAGQTILIPAKNIAVSPSSSSSSSSSSGTALQKHKVKPKETLYSIARHYGVSVAELQKANPGTTTLKVGETINVPGKERAAVVQKKPALPATHVVEPKETLYSISRKYGVPVAELQKNNPGVKELQVGQEINITQAATAKREDKEDPKPREEVKKAEKPVEKKTVSNAEQQPSNTDAIPPKKEERKYVPVKDPKYTGGPENNMPTFSNLKKDGYTKVNETGMAEMYEDNSGFHYALHKTAPIGTIIYLVNEENGQKVYVRVMGRLTDADPGVILKVSSKAYEKLSAKTNSKVKVSATYIP